MASDKERKLEMAVAALQDRWGVRAIHRLGGDQDATVPPIPTGFPALDEVLQVGGLPRGRISELIGAPTSGIATIALKTIASAQAGSMQGRPIRPSTQLRHCAERSEGMAQGRHAGPPPQTDFAVYIDPGRTFDPDYAARYGLDLDRLLLVHPRDPRQSLAILQDFIFGGGLGVLVFDCPPGLLATPQLSQTLSTTLGRLIAPLGQSNCALLFLTSLPAGRPQAPADSESSGVSLPGYPAGTTLPHYATIRLFVQRQRWLYKRRDIRGYQARVLVVKNKLGPAGGEASIAITLDGTTASQSRDLSRAERSDKP